MFSTSMAFVQSAKFFVCCLPSQTLHTKLGWCVGDTPVTQVVFFWTLLARQISQFFDKHQELKPKLLPPSQYEMESRQTTLSQEQTDQIKEIFDLFDTDGGGSMDRQELAVAMCALGIQNMRTSPGQHPSNELMLRTIDLDGSNTVSLDEFTALMNGELTMSNPLQEIRAVFAGICNMDSSDPGQINLLKLRLAAQEYEVKLLDHEITLMMDEVDDDGSKTVDEAEFIRIMNLSTWF
jgi:Ca2+-binding EF-hand superfamily protein